jgi:hypothetical protein
VIHSDPPPAHFQGTPCSFLSLPEHMAYADRSLGQQRLNRFFQTEVGRGSLINIVVPYSLPTLFSNTYHNFTLLTCNFFFFAPPLMLIPSAFDRKFASQPQAKVLVVINEMAAQGKISESTRITLKV